MTGFFLLERAKGPAFRQYGFIARRGDKILFRCVIGADAASELLDPEEPATHIVFDDQSTARISMLQIGSTDDPRGECLILGEHGTPQPKRASSC